MINSHVWQFHWNHKGREISEFCKVVRPVSDLGTWVNRSKIYRAVAVSEPVAAKHHPKSRSVHFDKLLHNYTMAIFFEKHKRVLLGTAVLHPLWRYFADKFVAELLCFVKAVLTNFCHADHTLTFLPRRLKINFTWFTEICQIYHKKQWQETASWWEWLNCYWCLGLTPCLWFHAMLELASAHFWSLSFKAHGSRKGKKLSSLIQNSLASVFHSISWWDSTNYMQLMLSRLLIALWKARAIVTARKNHSRIENTNRFEQEFDA